MADGYGWYCEEPTHGGNAPQLHPSRYFTGSLEGAPTCPVCQRQTNCIAGTQDNPPVSQVMLQERLSRTAI